VSRTLASPSSLQRTLFHARFLLPEGPHALVTFIDSGADASIIDEELADSWGLDVFSFLAQSLPAPSAAISWGLSPTRLPPSTSFCPVTTTKLFNFTFCHHHGFP